MNKPAFDAPGIRNTLLRRGLVLPGVILLLVVVSTILLIGEGVESWISHNRRWAIRLWQVQANYFRDIKIASQKIWKGTNK